MGNLIKQNDQLTYQQDDGEITAWFDGFEEHLELAHEGDPKFQMIFYILVIIGLVYLTNVFIFF